MTSAAGGAQRRSSAFSDARFMRQLFELLPTMVAYWDRDLRMVIANPAYIAWFGLRPDQVPGVHMREVVGDAVYELNQEHISAALRGEPQVFERALVDTARRTRHTRVSFLPDASDGEVLGFFAVVADTTEAVEAQRLLAEAQRIAELGTYTWDAAGDRIVMSDEMCRIAGIDPQLASADFTDYLELIHHDDRDQLQEKVELALTTGAAYEADYRLLRPDGDVRFIHTRARAVFAADGSVERINGVAQDVTEAEQAERELMRLYGELERANALHSDLIAMLSHEARQPLALVRLLIESLLTSWDEVPDDVRQDDLRRAVHATYELGQLFDDVLAMTYLESGRAISGRTPTSVHEAVARSLALTPDAADIQVDVPEQLTVVAEPWQLRQMITNLINNALKYGAAPIEVSARAAGDAVEINVVDHGAGVPDGFVPQLFERFTRGQRSGPRGTGFGLYIVRRLAETNNGSVGYRRAEPTGAVFTIRLPAGPAAVDQ